MHIEPFAFRPQVMDTNGKAVPHVYCIGDANGKLMLAHAASAQGISAVENMVGREHVLNHLSVPAACFTHPEARSWLDDLTFSAVQSWSPRICPQDRVLRLMQDP